MSMLPIEEKDYSDGMTKQSFKDSCDINKMLKKAQRTGSLAHLQKYPEASYGVFENYDLLEAHNHLAKANEIFGELPSEVRSEFGGDPIAFIQFAANPENNAKLRDLLPAIAEPGSYFPNPVQRGGTGAGAATAPSEGGGSEPPPDDSGGDPPAPEPGTEP